MTNTDLGPKKTVFIMVIVVGCFAVLWPKVFYPMYAGTMYSTKSQDHSAGCCDVIWETDVNAIRIMVDLCGNILKSLRETDPRVQLAFENGKLTNDIIEKCRSKVMSTCNVDIALFLKENVALGRTYRQILDELRSTNSSLCLKYNFGVTPNALGARHQIRIEPSKILNVRQERPVHLHSDLLHPALRERGRAMPNLHQTSKKSSPQIHHQPPPRVVPGRPGPIPGMRPTIGGAGHVVPPPKTSTSTMGIVMPIYTIGIVIFFTYTLMKVRANNQQRLNAMYDQTTFTEARTLHKDDTDSDVEIPENIQQTGKLKRLKKLQWIQKNFQAYCLNEEEKEMKEKQIVLLRSRQSS